MSENRWLFLLTLCLVMSLWNALNGRIQWTVLWWVTLAITAEVKENTK